MTLGAAQSFNAASGNLTVSGAVTNGGNTLYLNGASNVTVSGGISGSGGLTMNGTGTATLTGSNSYTGGTIVGSGQLNLGNNSALGAGSGSLTVNGTLDLAGNSPTQNGLSGSSNGVITNSGGATTLTVGSGDGPGLYAGSINGSIALTKVGGGTQNLSGNNVYTGSTAVNAGALALGTNNALPAGTTLSVGTAVTSATFAMGGYTNGVGGMTLTNGSILAIAANQTDSAQLVATGTVNFGTNNTIDLTGMTNTAGLYRLVSGSALTGAFLVTNGLDAAYMLTTNVNANELDAQHRGAFGTVTASTATNAIITGASTPITFSVANTAPLLSAGLTFTASTNAGVSGAASGTLAAQTGTNVSGLSFSGTNVGANQIGSITLTDPNAVVTAVTTNVSVNVYGHANGSLSTNAVSIGNLHVGTKYSSTSQLVASNAAGYNVNMAGNAVYSGQVGLGSITNVAPGATTSMAVTLGSNQPAGAINSTITYTFADNSTLAGASTNVGSASVTVTGGVYGYAAGTFRSTNVINNTHVGSAFTPVLISLSNSATGAAGYVENLSGSFTNGIGVTGGSPERDDWSGAVITDTFRGNRTLQQHPDHQHDFRDGRGLQLRGGLGVRDQHQLWEHPRGRELWEQQRGDREYGTAGLQRRAQREPEQQWFGQLRRGFQRLGGSVQQQHHRRPG